MWLVEGPFDGKATEIEHKKLKLLKCGAVYPLGRKPKEPTQLVITYPKISTDHATFTVGEHSTEDVSNPLIIPSLTLTHSRPKGLNVVRGENEEHVAPEQPYDLMDGDVVFLVTTVSLTVRWKSVCCLVPPRSPPVSFGECAALGIKLVSTTSDEETHHLTPSLSITPLILTSMLRSSQLVSRDWLSEYIRLGMEPRDTTSPLTALEHEFIPPLESKFRPTFDAGLPSTLSVFKPWDANEERINMLKGWRLLFVGEKGREIDSDILKMIEVGGAEYEVFDVSSGERKWRQSLQKNKRKAVKGLAVVGNEEVMRVVAGENWDIIDEVLQELEMRFISREYLFNAILRVSTSLIDSNKKDGEECNPGSSSIDPDPDQAEASPPLSSVMNTHPEEPSIPPESIISQQNATEDDAAAARPSKRPLRRRGTGTSNVDQTVNEVAAPVPPVNLLPEGEAELQPEQPAPRRKPLVRRARTALTNGLLDKAIVGVDDPSIIDSQPLILESNPIPSTSAISPPDEVIASGAAGPSVPSSMAPPSRSSRLKRRRGNEEAMLNPVLAELERGIEQASQRPPSLKKFKALFDETDPDRLESQSGALTFSAFDEDGTSAGAATHAGSVVPVTQAGSESQTQVDTQSGRHGNEPPKRLPPVAEEAEESMNMVVPTSSVTAPQSSSKDMEIDESAGPSNRAHSVAPNKPVSCVSQQPFSSIQQRKSKSKENTGAPPGKPDTDKQFLKALASTKKGKRKEDDFDREFNNLRISKPELEKDAEVKQWDILAEFGDDSDVRGNFMVIVEIDVPDKRDRNTGEQRALWQGKPNFKRFKKKNVERTRNTVDLVVEEDNDFGMGPLYWNGVSQLESQSQEQSQGVELSQPVRTQGKSATRKTKQDGKGSRLPSEEPRKGRARKVLKDESDDDPEATLRSTSRKGTQTGGRSRNKVPLFLPDDDDGGPVVTVADDDSGAEVFDLNVSDVSLDEDDEPPPKAKRGKEPPSRADTTGKRKRGAVLMDDDSDMAFKGFGTRKKTRT